MSHLLRTVLVLVLWVPLIPIGCDLVDDGDCRCNDISDYEITELTNLYVEGVDPRTATDDTVLVEELRIRASFALEEAPRQAQIIRSKPWGFRAFACSCLGPRTLTTITDLSIISSADVNEEFPAGTELSDLFASSFERLDDGSYVVDLNYSVGPSGNETFEGGLSLRASDIGAWDSNVHQFSVSMTLSDGEEFIRVLDPVFLDRD